jgi:hypothetical protein
MKAQKAAVRTLSAAKLKLPDVPRRERKEVRKFLAPLLGNLSIKVGECWNNSQQLMSVANSPRVGYVEGVYEANGSRCVCWCEHEFKPIPHGWNTVDGHLVDLTLEFRWATEPTFNKNWLHEPFKSYSSAEFRMFTDEVDDLDGLSVTPVVFNYGYADEFGLGYSEEESDYIAEQGAIEGGDWESLMFVKAADRMIARYAEAAAEPQYLKDVVWQNDKYLADLRQRKKEFEYPTQVPMFPIEVAA